MKMEEKDLEYIRKLIEKANNSLHREMGGKGNYLEEEVEIETVKSILKNKYNKA